MTDHLKQYGPQLIANGYLPVPIPRGKKFPSYKGWQNLRLSAAQCANFPGHGVGILCGTGANPIIGVDIDISHPVLGPQVMDWCRTHLGDTIERVGAAPRTMLVYRADKPGITKGSTLKFYDDKDPLKPSGKKNEQQVEILGLGQQFVVYHEHPDTKAEYQWVDLMGGIAHMPALDLPVVSEDQLNALIVEVARLVKIQVEAGKVTLVKNADGLQGVSSFDGETDDLALLTSKLDKPFDEIKALVEFMRNTDDGYETWLNVGMALHHEYHGTEHEQDALELWREYGSRSSKDQASQYEYKWDSFGGGSRSTTLRWLIKIANQEKADQEDTEKVENLEAIRKLISEQTRTIDLGGKKVLEKLRLLMPDDQLLRAEVVALFQAQHKALSGHGLPVSTARQLVLGARQATVKSKRPLTEFGNAERMMDRYGDGLMYVPEIDTWYLWTGVYWREAVMVEIEHIAKETIRSLPDERDEHEGDEAAEFYQFCAISQQKRMVQNMVALAASDPRVMVPARELDKHSHLLGVQNGVVDLRTGQLLPPDQDYHITLVAGTSYVPSARCPLYEQTIVDCFNGNMDLASFYVLSLGYALRGRPVEDVMFLPFGSGSNGKSTLYGIARQAFGMYARSADASSFVRDGAQANAGGAREDLVRLRGARMVYVSEPDENGELREGAVKSMTGGDAIAARGVYAKKSVEITPTWVPFMPTNHKPIVKGSDNGIWRRMVLVPFERNFDDDPTIVKDEHREEKLLAEMQGVLAMIVRACLRYQQSGLKLPESIKSSRQQYKKQMDLLAEWLEDCCEVGEHLVEESNRLWSSWEAYAKNRGILGYVKSSVALGRRLDSRFIADKGARGVRLRRGLALKSSFSGETDVFGDVLVAGGGGSDPF